MQKFIAASLLATLTLAVMPAHSQGAPANLQGAWRGNATFAFEKDSGPVTDAKASGLLEVMVSADGSVKGSVGSCRFTGTATPNAKVSGETLVDLAATDCTDRRFNGRYSASLKVVDGKAEAKLTSIRPFKMEVAKISGLITR